MNDAVDFVTPAARLVGHFADRQVVLGLASEHRIERFLDGRFDRVAGLVAEPLLQTLRATQVQAAERGSRGGAHGRVGVVEPTA